jgi:hypothetical protein
MTPKPTLNLSIVKILLIVFPLLVAALLIRTKVAGYSQSGSLLLSGFIVAVIGGLTKIGSP